MQSNTTSITTIKQEVRLQEWSAQIEAQQSSGLTIREWCKENGIGATFKREYPHREKRFAHIAAG